MCATFAVAAIALLQSSAAYTFPAPLPDLVKSLRFEAGFEPFRATGERGPGQARECSLGHFKPNEGASACQACADGFIAPQEGATQCTPCLPASTMTSDPSHIHCVSKSSSSQRNAADPANARVYGRDWKALANTPLDPRPCNDEEEGSKRCPIPVGWWDNDRSGSVFFPKEYKDKEIPYMLLLHGSGWTGSDMINVFKEYAIKYKFAIIAPDSHDKFYWSAPDKATDNPTADLYHIQGCWDAVMNTTNFPGVKADSKFLTSFGNSYASYAATSYATRTTPDYFSTNFTSAAVLHAAALPEQMGDRVLPILWVTGDVDPLYGVDVAKVDVAKFEKEKPQFDVSWQVWQDSHTIRNYTQIEHMVKWWLDPSIRDDPIQTN